MNHTAKTTYSPDDLLIAQILDDEIDQHCALRDGLQAYADEVSVRLAGNLEKVQIVVARLDFIRGRVCTQAIPRAAVWLTKGSLVGLKQARDWAAKEGYSVFLLPASCEEPLEEAKRRISDDQDSLQG